MARTPGACIRLDDCGCGCLSPYHRQHVEIVATTAMAVHRAVAVRMRVRDCHIRTPEQRRRKQIHLGATHTIRLTNTSELDTATGGGRESSFANVWFVQCGAVLVRPDRDAGRGDGDPLERPVQHWRAEQSRHRVEQHIKAEP